MLTHRLKAGGEGEYEEVVGWASPSRDMKWSKLGDSVKDEKPGAVKPWSAKSQKMPVTEQQHKCVNHCILLVVC